MKQTLIKVAALTALCVFMTTALPVDSLAQSTDSLTIDSLISVIEKIDLEKGAADLFDAENPDLINWFNLIHGFLVVLFGFLASAFGLKKWAGQNFVLIVVAFGLVAIGAFVALGFGKALPLVITLFATLGLFDTIFKPKTPLNTLAKKIEK